MPLIEKHGKKEMMVLNTAPAQKQFNYWRLLENENAQIFSAEGLR
jgi:hypothetical protein